MINHSFLKNRAFCLTEFPLLSPFKCVIDLGKNTLKIGDVDTPFLGESEIPKDFDAEEEEKKKREEPVTTSSPLPPSTSSPAPKPTPPATQSQPPQPSISPFQMPQLQFPVPQQTQARTTPQPQPAAQQFSEEHISTLMSFGASRQQAIQALSAAGGNIDVAASFLFP